MSWQSKLERATGVSCGSTKSERRKSKHRKTNAKRWFITKFLENHPNSSDTTLKAAVRREFNEGVGDYVIKEVRRIYNSKVVTGEIVPRDVPVRLENVVTQIDRLSDKDKEKLFNYLHNRPRRGKYYKCDEIAVRLPDGWTVCSGDRRIIAGGYVRLLDPDGEEYMYWDHEEWRKEPKLCMGAIMNAIAGYRFFKPRDSVSV